MDAKVIIIAGDMFDTKSVNKKTKEYLTVSPMVIYIPDKK